MKSAISLFLLITSVLMPTSVIAQETRINWFVLSGGFAVANSGSHSMKSIVGQVAVGRSSAPTSTATHGFLVRVQAPTTDITSGNLSLPAEYNLHQNFPNPFNPATTIRYDLPKFSKVKLTVHNVLGVLVAVLVDGEKPPGRYSVTLDASNLPSGVYFYQLLAGEVTQVKKLVFAK